MQRPTLLAVLVSALVVLSTPALALTCGADEQAVYGMLANRYCYQSAGGSDWVVKGCVPADMQCPERHVFVEEGASGQAVVLERDCIPTGFTRMNAFSDCTPPAGMCSSAEKTIFVDSAEMKCVGRASSCGYDSMFAGCVPKDQECRPASIFAEHVIDGMAGTFFFDTDCVAASGFDILDGVDSCMELGCEFVNCPHGQVCESVEGVNQCVADVPVGDGGAAPGDDDDDDQTDADDGDNDVDDGSDDADDDDDDDDATDSEDGGSQEQNPPPAGPVSGGGSNAGPQPATPIVPQSDDASASVVVATAGASIFAMAGIAGFLYQKRRVSGPATKGGYSQLDQNV